MAMAARPLALFLILCAFFFNGAAAWAVDFGRAMVEIRGPNGDVVVFTPEMTSEIGEARVHTWTPFTDRAHTYEGVRLADLIDYCGLSGEELVIGALDGYQAVIPIELVRRYDIILAVERDDRPLRVMDKGPALIVFPLEDHPELDDELNHARSVWHVKSIMAR